MLGIALAVVSIIFWSNSHREQDKEGQQLQKILCQLGTIVAGVLIIFGIILADFHRGRSPSYGRVSELVAPTCDKKSAGKGGDIGSYGIRSRGRTTGVIFIALAILTVSLGIYCYSWAKNPDNTAGAETASESRGYQHLGAMFLMVGVLSLIIGVMLIVFANDDLPWIRAERLADGKDVEVQYDAGYIRVFAEQSTC
jgi:hypothetical protein